MYSFSTVHDLAAKAKKLKMVEEMRERAVERLAAAGPRVPPGEDAWPWWAAPWSVRDMGHHNFEWNDEWNDVQVEKDKDDSDDEGISLGSQDSDGENEDLIADQFEEDGFIILSDDDVEEEETRPFLGLPPAKRRKIVITESDEDE